MQELIVDVETTISNKGGPFDQTNTCVCIGVKDNSNISIAYEEHFDYLQEIIDQAEILVGFNFKFDLHWLRRIGIDISEITVWDCQLAEFILNNQKTPYPSLDSCAIKYGFPLKLDVVKTQYWDLGIDTNEIPREVLSEYLSRDLDLTQQVYAKQKEQFENEANGKYALFKLQCMDLLVLEEVEYNGIKFNTNKALTKAQEIEVELASITQQLTLQTGGVPLNYNSGDDLSCLLYGGVFVETYRVPIGVYKTGKKIGETRFKVLEKNYTLPRLVEPIEGTLVKKSKEHPENQQYWEVNDTVLRKLKLTGAAKTVVKLLNEYAKLEKLRGTYLMGYSKLIDTMHWEKDTLHGTLNQCVAITGRLSSSKPNLQNADPITKVYMESRYKTT